MPINFSKLDIIKISISKFFRTAPHTKSQKVLNLEKTGKITSLLEAIEDERHALEGHGGKSKDGNIRVKRAGAYHF